MEDRIIFAEEAKIEFHKAKCYFEMTEKEEAFWNDVNRQMDLLELMPFAFQIRYKNVRIIHLERFNFSIHYVIKDYGVLIYRFLNKRQDY